MAKLTQKAILHTFDEMLREMPFEKITVSALVSRCEISSNTFYYHYQDIYELLDTWLDIKLAPYFADSCVSDDDWKTVLKALLQNFQDNSLVVSHVFNSIPRERFERYFFTVLQGSVDSMVHQRAKGQNLSERTTKMLSQAILYALAGFILKFNWDGLKGNIDEIFDPIIDFMDFSVTAYVAREVSGKR